MRIHRKKPGCCGEVAKKRSPGFTLVEILVVIVILVLLVTILLPTVIRTRDLAKIAASQTTINMLAGGVDMYKIDFNALPPSAQPNGSPGDYLPDWKGAELFCLLMTGYASDEGTAGDPLDDSSHDQLNEDDGKEGFGFRTEKRGKVYGPYNGAENVKVKDGPNGKVFVDNFDNPILYYRYDEINGYVEGHNYDSDPNKTVYPDPPGAPSQDYLDALTASLGSRSYLLLTVGIDQNWGCYDEDSKDWNHFPQDGPDPEYRWSDFDDIGNFEKK